MARIKIQDLPGDVKISQDEMKKVLGGIDTVPLPDMPSLFLRRMVSTRFTPSHSLPLPLFYERKKEYP